LDTCYTPTQIVPDILEQESFAAVLAAPLGSYLLTNLGRVFYFDDKHVRLDAELTDLSLNTSRIRKMVTSAVSAHFLLQNGDVWTRVHTSDTTFANYATTTTSSIYSSSLPPTSTGIFKADFGIALPPNFLVRDIVASSGGTSVFAIAHPVNGHNVEPPLRLPEPPMKNSKRLVYWGTCPIHNAGSTPFETNQSPIVRVMPTELDLRHLATSNVAADEILRWTFDGLNMLIQTDHHLLALGAYKGTAGYGLSPYAEFASWRLAQLMDPWLYGDNMALVQDIASSNSTHLILLSNGTLIQWGLETNAVPPAKRSSQLTTPPLSATARIRTFSGFSSVTARLGGIGAIDYDGQISTWGGELSPAGPGGPPFLHQHSILDQYGTALKLSMRADGFLAVMSTSPVGSASSLVVMSVSTDPGTIYDCVTAAWPNPTESQYKYCHLELPNEISDASQIVDMVGGATWVSIRTLSGAWYLGHAPFLPVFEYTWAAIPIPINVANGWNQVQNLVFTDENMYWHLVDGSVWATCGDWPTFCVPGQTGPSGGAIQVVKILDGWNVLSMRSVVGDCQMALVEERPRDPEVPFLTRYFGESTSGISGHGITNYATAILSGELLPIGHPLESETAANIEIGAVGILSDGTYPSSNNPRYVVWGDGASAPISYPALPGLFNLEPWMDLDHEQVVKVFSPRSDILILFRNCSILSARPYNVVPATATSEWLDPTYNSTVRRFHINYLFTLNPFSNTDCQSDSTSVGATDASRLDIQCVPISIQAGMTCVALGPTGNSFYVMYERLNPNFDVIDCQSGFYGDILDCQDRIDTNPVYTSMEFEIPITGVVPEGRSVAQYAAGLYHAIVLLDDGTLFAWGSNRQGQLGIQGIARAAEPQPISIPSAYGGEPITQVIASKRNSYALFSNRYVLSWGSNFHGGLGNGDPTVSFSDTPSPVQAPALPIRQLACAAHSCYLLYMNGEVYSWGHNAMQLLGRETPLLGQTIPNLNPGPFSATPALATMFTFPHAPSRKITQLVARASSMGVFVRAGFDTGPSTPATSCSGSPPSPQFVCVDGAWVVVGNVVVGGGNGTNPTFVITGPTVVIGNVTVSPGSVVTVANPSEYSGKPLLNVTGCFTGDMFEITLDPLTFKTQKTKLDGTEIYLVESSCAMNAGTVTVSTPKDCRKTTATTKSEEKGNGRFGLVSVFKVDRSKCSVWWIILVSVLGVILVGVVVAVIVWKVWRNKRFAPVEST
jgi:hypothetical protein